MFLRAKVVAAEGEQKASLALKEAADTINKVYFIFYYYKVDQ